MSTAKIKTVDHKRLVYFSQNEGAYLTPAQERQLRKTQTRLDHTESHSINKERKRNRRQRLRDWMKGIKG